jgi:hypothetical protein
MFLSTLKACIFDGSDIGTSHIAGYDVVKEIVVIAVIAQMYNNRIT